MGTTHNEIHALYKQHGSIRAVTRAYNRSRVKKDQLSRTTIETMLRSSKKIPAAHKPVLTGLVVWCSLLAAGTLVHMHTLITQAGWYFELYRHWPREFIVLRYAFSWFQRIAWSVCIIGVLSYKEFFRKALILLGAFVILTVAWKHPYGAFLHHMQMLDEKIGHAFNTAWASLGIPQLTFIKLVIPAIVVHCIIDIIFWGGLLFYLTRPHVKKLFD